MAQEDDLRALGKIMDFLRAVSIILAIMNVYWYCYEAMHIWGVTIGVVDRILINFNRTGGLFQESAHPKSSHQQADITRCHCKYVQRGIAQIRYRQQ